MNYRHAFHAGNHADVLKHAAMLALCDALVAKPTPLFALDTHAGRGMYWLDAAQAKRTGEAAGGIDAIDRLQPGTEPAPLRMYVDAISACRQVHGPMAYPGSPWLLAHALRVQDRIACCELQPEEAEALKASIGGDARVAVHARDGYSAMHALLPPRLGNERFGRGLVLIDPPFEAQLEEFTTALRALRDALERWPQGTYALWYPIKQRRALQRTYRSMATMPAKSVLLVELLVRPDDSPLRMNGSGLMLLNAPWQFDARMRELLPVLADLLGEGTGASWRVEWLKAPA
ncbi:23S rRNA (adenine(2030)-N(6))-methyltransferase RlmJ [Cognatilysobacter terrigena]|uniref:23S rRNA (adenine(2030)-N(6))-methyltransferase RlmJ n=1 Tax=Cognatilysobacter terrigena TaxID=2488749 RepID=UPI00105EB7B1|nr:23S rRNA (adenine(2030)-N(6))-methyltransferase RlmJ [Lysobacter terrigena]